MCEEISYFATSTDTGESKSVRLAVGGAWMVDHYKSCQRDETDPAALKFCSWLMENTSTEFMEANINRVISCLQGQEIEGYIGNTGIRNWVGTIQFYFPHIEAEGVEIEVEYAMGNFNFGIEEDFMKITAIRSD